MYLFALTSLPLAALLLDICNARPTNSVVLEKIESSPTGWTLDPAANVDKESTTLTLKIHLTNQGMDDFHRLALDVRKHCNLVYCVIVVAEQTCRLRLQEVPSTANTWTMNRSYP